MSQQTIRHSVNKDIIESHAAHAADQDDHFRSLILDHSNHPRHFGALADSNRLGEANNPVCGDRYRVYLKLVEGRIDEIRFTGTGCSISMASASMMTEMARHTPRCEIDSLIDRFYASFSRQPLAEMDDSLGDLEALAAVRRNPVRIRCATLPWNALVMALRSEPVHSPQGAIVEK